MTISVLERLKIRVLGSPEQRVIRCVFFHQWSKWEPYKQPYTHFFQTPPPGHYFFTNRQRRQCSRCGLTQDVKLG